MSEPTRGPWNYVELGSTKGGPYIEIRGPNGEAICTIFPDAGAGGVGLEAARANAQWIVRAALGEAKDE